MKIFTPLLFALVVLCANWSVPALASPPSQGIVVSVPPLMSKGEAQNSQPMNARLPSQVGTVSSVLPGDFVAGFASAIVLGDKRGSLCYETKPDGPGSVPRTSRLASFCKPILSKSYKDVTIEQVKVGNGNRGLLFTAKPGSKGSSETVKFAAKSFMAGLERAQKSLARHAAKPSTVSPKLIAGGSSCGYDDEDDTPICEGGGGGDGGGGGGGGGDYPGSGGDWGDPTGGYSATSTGCVPIPAGWLCTGKRDVPWSDPWTSPVPPSGSTGEPNTGIDWTTPWFPQSWCNHIHILCSGGQEAQDNDRGDNASLSGKTMDQLYQICDAIFEVEMDVCMTDYKMRRADYRLLKACESKAADRLSACMSTARRVTDNGVHRAP